MMKGSGCLLALPKSNMEVSWQNLFSGMGVEDSGGMFNQGKSLMDEEEEVAIGELLQMSTESSESHSSQTSSKRCRKSSSPNSNGSIASSSHFQLPHILSFHDCDAPAGGGGGNTKGRMMRRKGTRSSSESLDHIMAERKRRQELTERFIALSATIPGLKKIDKASILSEAITYIKQLRERVNKLEQQTSNKIKVESVSFINKPKDEGTASCKTNSHHHHDNCHRLIDSVGLPEIEARALENEVLVRIHCKKQSSVMLKILTHLKSLALSIVSNSVLPFGNSALDITIVAQMGDKYNVTVKDLVKSLRLAIMESPEIQQ